MISGANPYNANRGVGALAYSAVHLVGDLFARRGQPVEIVLANREFGAHRKDTIRMAGREYSVTNIFPVDLFGVLKIARSFLSGGGFRSLRTFAGCDYVLDIGAGDSFSDIYGRERFRDIDNRHRMARLFSKKEMFLPQTVGPFSDPGIRRRAVRSLEYASMVLARDRQSYDYVRANTAQKEVYESIDVAFFMPFERREFDAGSLHVGLNVSALLWNGGYTRDNQFGLAADYRRVVRELIAGFLGRGNVTLHLVPHVVLPHPDVENDYKVSQELMAEFNDPRLVLAPFFGDPVEAKGYIAGLDFFCGARMHACIAAFSSGIAVCPMAYSRKFNGLFADTLDYAAMADMTAQATGEVVRTVADAFENRDALEQVITRRIETTVREKGRLLEDKFVEFFGL